MAWIKVIDYDNADTKLKKVYDKVRGANGQIDNVLAIHSLRPHSLVGHMALYKNVLHNSNNTLPKWYLETIGVLVSFLNQCDYCVDHHFEGLKRLLKNDVRADEIQQGIKNNTYHDLFDNH
ncbi:MAG: carboxymuconolactone decarboxylase family protein, partial [Bacteroidia bacterium]|nr:carboxymuconolactone decarboxylase family protein [Bacteroidia bacterium]